MSTKLTPFSPISWLQSTSSLPKVIDLRDLQLTHGSAAVLSDLLSIDFGLRKLILDNCGLDDEVRGFLFSYSGVGQSLNVFFINLS